MPAIETSGTGTTGDENEHSYPFSDFAVAVVAGLSAVEARDYGLDQNGRTPAQYDLNNPSDVRSFWDDQATRNAN